MAALPNLITVEEFRRMPDDGRAYELHHGEVVLVTRPKARHYKLQWRLLDLIKVRLAGFGFVGIELAYRPTPEFDLRVADVAVVSQARWEAIDPEDNLRGAPELVIEIKSPSNTTRKLRDLASLCLTNGCLECWIVDAETACVTVIHRDGSTALFRAGDSIPLTAFEGDPLAVDAIFAAE